MGPRHRTCSIAKLQTVTVTTTEDLVTTIAVGERQSAPWGAIKEIPAADGNTAAGEMHSATQQGSHLWERGQRSWTEGIEHLVNKEGVITTALTDMCQGEGPGQDLGIDLSTTIAIERGVVT
jgi:hypothetical protein